MTLAAHSGVNGQAADLCLSSGLNGVLLMVVMCFGDTVSIASQPVTFKAGVN